MTAQERIKSLSEWGNKMSTLSTDELELLFEKAENNNRWFTKPGCANALNGILSWLQLPTLQDWASHYALPNQQTNKSVGLVMAGNIPLVGFHDLLCVLLSGHSAKIKLSSQDEVLLPYLTSILVSIDEGWQNYFSYESRLQNVDAVIATGSDNSARYFDYYFKQIPRVIRKNRTSIAVIMGEESPDECKELGTDVFTYFGLGCRNVSKIFVPENFDLDILIKSFAGFQDIINHNKYANNYDYQRAIRLISGKKFLDGGFFLLEESTELVSPISVLYYAYCKNLSDLTDILKSNEEKLQCIVSAKGWWAGSIAFGEAQTPLVTDYSDHVDTMRFLGL